MKAQAIMGNNWLNVCRLECRRFGLMARREQIKAKNARSVEAQIQHDDMAFHYAMKAMAAQTLMQMEIGL